MQMLYVKFGDSNPVLSGDPDSNSDDDSTLDNEATLDDDDPDPYAKYATHNPSFM